MPWCPKCKYEYVAGMTKCADCGSELVDELPSEDMETREELSLNKNGTLPLKEQENGDDVSAPAEKEAVSRGVYKDNAQKAAEFKDSGYTLLGVGAIGLILIILMSTGVIPFQLFGSMAYLSYGVMGALFLIFIIVGFYSMRSAKNYRKEALSESNLKEEILNWCRKNLTAEEIDASIEDSEMTEEEKYFQRMQAMKQLVSEKFMNLDEGMLDHLLDEFYAERFGA